MAIERAAVATAARLARAKENVLRIVWVPLEKCGGEWLSLGIDGRRAAT
jgi:hypothetical protein